MTSVVYQEPYSATTRGDRWGDTVGRPHPHRGQDWAPGGVDALAVADGTVALSQWSDVLGHVLVLRHADGMYSGYCHLATVPTAKLGAHVARHASLGAKLGQTGTAATGRHLHLTIADHLDGVFQGTTVDPLKWILAHGPAAPKPATYTVQDHDTLTGIGSKTGIAWQTIAKLNHLAAPYLIRAKQVLKLR